MTEESTRESNLNLPPGSRVGSNAYRAESPSEPKYTLRQPKLSIRTVIGTDPFSAGPARFVYAASSSDADSRAFSTAIGNSIAKKRSAE